MIAKEPTITLTVGLDENRVPEKITWSAQEGGVTDQSVKAIFLSAWNPEQAELLRVDLWTKDMPLDDMKRFFHQVFIAMAAAYNRATSQEKLAAEIQGFAGYFARQAGILKADDPD